MTRMRITRDRRARPGLSPSTIARLEQLIERFRVADRMTRDRIGQLLTRFGFEVAALD